MEPKTNTDPVPTPTPTPVPAEPSIPTPVPGPTVPTGLPTVTVGGDFVPAETVSGASTSTQPVVSPSPGRFSKKMLVGGIALILLLGGAAAYYFGYYMSPGVIYSQSLKNTGKGYDKLVAYIDTQSKLTKQGYSGDGSFQFKSAGFAADGKMTFRADGDNGEFSFDVGAAGARYAFEGRAIKSSTATPDLYLKASGIKGLGGLLGTPELDAAVNSLDNTWIFVDHTLLDGLSGASQSNGVKEPSREEVMDEVRAFGKVNQDYIFTTDKDKAVTMIVKKHGVETVEGRKAYHYTAALQKENVKKYIEAQRDALKASKLGAWLKKNKYDTETYAQFDDMKKSADKIKSSDTFDVWMDVKQRIVYKVRISDPKNRAANYVDVGLNYKGGDRYPFFINGQSKEGGTVSSGSLLTTLDTKTGATELTFKGKSDGSEGGTASGTFTFQPSSKKITIAKPEGAKPLAQVLNELGFGDLFNSYVQGLSATAAPAADAVLTN